MPTIAFQLVGRAGCCSRTPNSVPSASGFGQHGAVEAGPSAAAVRVALEVVRTYLTLVRWPKPMLWRYEARREPNRSIVRYLISIPKQLSATRSPN